jgi:NACalpha-BTF3-like transcription factor
MVTKSAKKLVKQKYLIKEDIDVVVERCSYQYDEAISKGNKV